MSRVTVYKDGIRTTEFFRDHDKLRSGLITENQFVCGLSLCCEKSQQLTREEVQLLINCYRNDDGRVKYREFCDAMENGKRQTDSQTRQTHKQTDRQDRQTDKTDRQRDRRVDT